MKVPRLSQFNAYFHLNMDYKQRYYIGFWRSVKGHSDKKSGRAKIRHLSTPFQAFLRIFQGWYIMLNMTLFKYPIFRRAIWFLKYYFIILHENEYNWYFLASLVVKPNGSEIRRACKYPTGCQTFEIIFPDWIFFVGILPTFSGVIRRLEARAGWLFIRWLRHIILCAQFLG